MIDSAQAENRIRLMSLAARVGTLAERVGILAPLAGAVMSILLALACAASLPKPADSSLPPRSAANSSPGLTPSAVRAGDWSAFAGRSSTTAAVGGQLSKRFRLAGTFFAAGGDQPGESRRAALADLQTGEQLIVSENEMIRDILVVRIQSESIVLRGPSGEEQLWLSFASQSDGAGARIGDSAGTTNVTGYAADLAGSDRFGGKRVGERSWVFKRQALVGYYRELMEDPERLVKVFDSLKPVYTRDGKIDGYRLDVEGEADFFKSAGLRANDVIRTVNSQKMTNRNRAEYLIREFVQERANAFVLEVDRDGTTQRLVYQVR
jgi:type II secretory pathway component PulC